MNTSAFNLFIVDDNPMIATSLCKYLDNRFGNGLVISTFNSGRNAIEKVDKDTRIVILDYYLDGENGNDVLRSIKKINPDTEVIMLSSNEQIGIAIESFRNGASDYVIKGDNAFKKIKLLVYKTITYPLRVMVLEFGISKYLAIFLLTFLTMGIGIYLVSMFL